MNGYSQSFNNTTNFTITDCGGQICSPIVVSGLPTVIDGTFGLESVTIKINHTWDSDLDIYLVAPDLTTIELSTDNGGSGDHYGSGTNNNAGPYTVFHMSGAAGNVTAGAAPFTNTYIPEGNLGAANNGQNPNGTWQLCVTDDACGSTGFINAWQLDFTNTPAPPPVVGPGHNIGTGNLTACTGDLYDTGGNSSDYSNSESITETYCSDVPGDCISITFTSFSTESCCDDLTIYDGPNTGSPLIGTYSGTTLTGQTIQSSTGCLTFAWSSDGSVVDPGWEATITCGTCPTCVDGIQNGSETGIDCGGPNCPPCPCGDITIAALPYSVTGANTAGYADDYSSADACGSSYLNGNDVLYEYTPAANESVDILLSNSSSSSTGLFLWDGCPDDPSTNCVNYVTGSANLSMTCITLTGGTTYFIGVSSWPSPQSITYDLSITSNPTGTPTCGLNYTYSTTAYNPVSYTTGSLLTFSDDRMADAYTSIGFDFCYDGILYQDVLVSSNGYLLFPGCYSAHPFGTSRGPTDYSPYSISAAAPNTTNAPVNAIMGPWQDIYPSTLLADGEIRTLTTGAAPNQRFSATFRNVRMFSCTSLDFNGQISLYETTDNIEVHLLEKTVCSTFNGGAAILGITDYTGTNAIIPAGYNYPTQWTVNPGSPEAHRFASNCGVCSVLPVKLVEFTGKSMGDYNLLTWKTESEANSSHFVLERSNGGAMFYEVATIPAAGNSSNLLEYEAKHSNPSDLEYYRLRQVDFDGKIAYSKIISIRKKNRVDVEIYPNPASNALNFDFVLAEDDIYTITIADVIGNVYLKQINLSETNGKVTLDEFNDFAQGFYTVKITDSRNNVVKVDKIIKK
ncbi:MAG: proprotein convertase P-domain-containing protein [Flavobacteriales bacterium]|nr:proprotein convertase P-domain-containing protein [Flavobacteriales bacterium]